jgi:HEAT repeat protein
MSKKYSSIHNDNIKKNINGSKKLASGLSTSTTTSGKAVVSAFERFEKERLAFIQAVAEHSSRETHVEVMVQQLDAIPLLSALVSDPVPSIQLSAVLAIARFDADYY